MSQIPFKLFPFPSSPHSKDVGVFPPPRTWPGRSASSTKVLCNALEDNHDRWHTFFNHMGFHNHTAHALVALWALGADEVVIQSSYDACCTYQRHAFESPTVITEQNWIDHLGDERYYRAYLNFFTEEFQRLGLDALLERYIFSPEANFVVSAPKQPEMLSRLGASLHHPMIHLGYGLEFNLPGLVLEGIAQTAVHGGGSRILIPPSSFGFNDSITSQIAIKDDAGPTADIHAFTILARILADPRLANCQDIELAKLYPSIMMQYGEIIKEYVYQWSVGGDIAQKVEELVWLASLIYGVGGYERDGGFNADFFHAHIVTSALFLQSYIPHLTPESQRHLLRSWLSICLAFYIGRGRAQIDIARFFGNNDSLQVTPPGPLPTPSERALAISHPSNAVTPNTWIPVLQSAIVHPDEHVPKIQRALSHFAEVFGDVPRGTFTHTELKDADLIDGTLFVRAAVLTANRLGWVREGEAPDSEFVSSGWDRRGFFGQ